MIAIEREDFVKIFMANDKETEPDFIAFLRQIPEVRTTTTISFLFSTTFNRLVSWVSY